jgi:PP-loop superfamily ATP-utilizing enzyme
VQIAPDEMARLSDVQEDLERRICAVGYITVEIDPAGYRAA